ncbi:MAG: Protein translocase subunit SecE [Chloroflexi bacterium]|jgi:preprotein translocase SecE subunit|nr:Protein translocase subunit SecE [Chloroflexota bacterium]
MAEKSLLDDPTKEPAIVRFVKDERAEVQKVEWPSRKDTRNLTIVVLALTAVMSAVLGSLDLVLTFLYSTFQSLIRG